MGINILPNAAHLRECFDYCPDTGILTWRVRPIEHFANARGWKIWNGKRSGKLCGSLKRSGHLAVTVDDQAYFVHRIIWKMMTNQEPPPILDHRNRNRTDNRWLNLRAATATQSVQNTSRHSNNTSGFKCVVFDKRRGTFFANIRANGKRHHLGSFPTAEAAHAAYCAAAKNYFGEFWNPD